MDSKRAQDVLSRTGVIAHWDLFILAQLLESHPYLKMVWQEDEYSRGYAIEIYGQGGYMIGIIHPYSVLDVLKEASILPTHPLNLNLKYNAYA